MIQVSIIGLGNVGKALYNTLSTLNGIEIKDLYNRSAIEGYNSTQSLENLSDVDICFITVSDIAITEISRQLNFNSLIVHTSGTSEMSVLANHNYIGVFYPLQTITPKTNFEEVPICIEANSEENLKKLNHIAELISNRVFQINSKQRRKIHLAAVFINNFTNKMFQIGKEICDENQIPFDIFYPIIEETARKAILNHPKDVQTGPAKRGDLKTIELHLEQLKSEQKEIYQIITKSILKQ